MSKQPPQPARLKPVKPGQKFGRLTVTQIGWENEVRIAYCDCECGGKRKVRHYLLMKGEVRSCGCLAKEMRRLSSEERKAAKRKESNGVLPKTPSEERAHRAYAAVIGI